VNLPIGVNSTTTPSPPVLLAGEILDGAVEISGARTADGKSISCLQEALRHDLPAGENEEWSALADDFRTLVMIASLPDEAVSQDCFCFENSSVHGFAHRVAPDGNGSGPPLNSESDPCFRASDRAARVTGIDSLRQRTAKMRMPRPVARA